MAIAAIILGVLSLGITVAGAISSNADYAEYLSDLEDYEEEQAELAEEQGELALEEIDAQRDRIEGAFDRLADLERLRKSEIKTKREQAVEDVQFAEGQTTGHAERGFGLSGVRKSGTTLDLLTQIEGQFAKEESRVHTQADFQLKNLAQQMAEQKANLEGALEDLDFAEEEVRLQMEAGELQSNYTLSQIESAEEAANRAMGWEIAGASLNFGSTLALNLMNMDWGGNTLRNEPTMLTQNIGGGYTYGDYYGWGR